MLMAQYPPSAAMAALVGEKAVNFGAVYENYVAQELSAAGVGLYYYHHSKRGEVDFLTETIEGKVLPIEVKSGKDHKLHTALNNLLSTAEYGIDEAVVLSRVNVSTKTRNRGGGLVPPAVHGRPRGRAGGFARFLEIGAQERAPRPHRLGNSRIEASSAEIP